MDSPLYGQFTLSRRDLEVPPRFRRQECNGWRLYTHNSLPVHELLDPWGNRLGYLVGFVISEGKLHLSPTSFELPASQNLGEELIEQRLREFAGRYIFLLLSESPGSSLAYPDPFSSLAAVYSPNGKILSSTTSLLNFRDGCETTYPLDTFPNQKPNQFYPGDLTDFEDCYRLLPNHRLELDSWTVRRFWPQAGLQPDPMSEADRHVSHAVERLQANLSAIHATGQKIYSPLTAGWDSRVLLACAPADIRPDVEYVTICFKKKSFGYMVDQHISRLLAERHNLRHLPVAVTGSSKEDREQYYYRIGRAGGAGKATKFYRTPLTSLDMNAIWITGHGGEVARRHYAISAKDTILRPSAAELLRRSRLPQREEFLSATEEWMQGLPRDCSTALMVDLYYMECRLGGWAAPHLYGAAPFRVAMFPLSDRRLVDACLATPYKFRERYLVHHRMIEMCEPDMLKTPFEQLTGWTKWKHRLRLDRF